MKQRLTQSYLKECLTYDPDTGIFVWNTRPESHFKTKRAWNAWNARRENTEAGCISHASGYLAIGINGKPHRSHRLAFLYMEGYLPENDVDHINRVRNDNRWENLREASRRCNQQNCCISKNNTSGITGVFWNSNEDRWISHITILNEKISLGSFINFQDAVMARYQEELRNPLWTCSVESTAYKYLRDNNLIDECGQKDFSNYGIRNNNKSGVSGICFHEQSRRWRAYIMILGKQVNLGYFEKFEDAVIARYNEELTNPNWQFSDKSSAYKYLKENNLI